MPYNSIVSFALGVSNKIMYSWKHNRREPGDGSNDSKKEKYIFTFDELRLSLSLLGATYSLPGALPREGDRMRQGRPWRDFFSFVRVSDYFCLRQAA